MMHETVMRPRDQGVHTLHLQCALRRALWLRLETLGLSRALAARLAHARSSLSQVSGEIRMKTAQGCLKNLKAKKFSEVFCAFPAASKEDVEFVTTLQLQEVPSADKEAAKFRANLMVRSSSH